MKIYEFNQEQRLPISLQEAWTFFSEPKNLIKLTPSEMKMKLLKKEAGQGELHETVVFGFKLLGIIPQKWKSEIRDWNPPHSFRDIQITGPYRQWNHLHRLEEFNEGVKVIDHIKYALPAVPLSLIHI